MAAGVRPDPRGHGSPHPPPKPATDVADGKDLPVNRGLIGTIIGILVIVVLVLVIMQLT